MNEGPLIQAEDLAERLEDAALRIFDCRFDLARPDAGRAHYGDEHIPGAVYADLNRDLSVPQTPGAGRHPLPAPSEFEARLREWGVRSDSVVVAYDDTWLRDTGPISLRGDAGWRLLDLRFTGWGGNDTAAGRDGDDSMTGDDGNDDLLGDNGNDALFGGKGDDHIEGGGDDDHVVGGSGNDTLYGDQGNDRLMGGQPAKH